MAQAATDTAASTLSQEQFDYLSAEAGTASCISARLDGQPKRCDGLIISDYNATAASDRPYLLGILHCTEGHRNLQIVGCAHGDCADC